MDKYIIERRARIRLAFYLKRDHQVKLSVYGVYKVLVRAGEIKPRKHRPRKKPVYYQMNYPGQRVQVDVKYMPKIRLEGRPDPYQEYQYTAPFEWHKKTITPTGLKHHYADCRN